MVFKPGDPVWLLFGGQEAVPDGWQRGVVISAHPAAANWYRVDVLDYGPPPKPYEHWAGREPNIKPRMPPDELLKRCDLRWKYEPKPKVEEHS